MQINTMKRVIIETSDSTKDALDKLLLEKGQTLTDWFNNKVEEVIDSNMFSNLSSKDEGLNSLSDLRDTKKVLQKITDQDWSFTNDDTSYLSHSIHPYPAKYIPQIPNRIIKLLSLKGEKVWDPFGGSGTTALEALLLGRKALSSDINPIASIIGKAKTKTLTEEEDKELSELVLKLNILLLNEENLQTALSKNHDNILKYTPEIFNIDKWFHSNVIKELAYLKYIISEKLSKSSADVAWSVFSKIIIKLSFQDSETRYVSKYRDVESGTTVKVFSSEIQSVLIKLRKLAPLLRYREAEFIHANLVKDKVVDPCSVDLIVSSPPYPNATDYHLYHKFRIAWLGYDHKDMANHEIGSHLRHQRDNSEIETYLAEMNSCLKQMYIGLRPGRFAVLVIGDAQFKGKFFDTAQLVGEEARKIGFEITGIVSRKLHTTKRSFVSAARRLREEKLVIIRKCEESINLTLEAPPYKLWLYEDVIRKDEIRQLLGADLINSSKKLDNITINALSVDKLKRLTFTRSYKSENFKQEYTWQTVLENGDAFDNKINRKDPKYVTHGVHAYKGKFYPQLAKSLFNLANLNLGAHVVDPFCGSGTVLLEGSLNGYNCNGFDLNPIALKIAKVKSQIIHLDPFIVNHIIDDFIKDLNKINTKQDFKKSFNPLIIEELESWFPKLVLQKLCGILKLISDVPDPIVSEFLEVCLSSIIRDISQQDPIDLRIRRRKEPISDAPVVELLQKRILDQSNRLRAFFDKAKFAPYSFFHSKVNQGDCRLSNTFEKAGIKDNSIDAIVTSPPYATALPYIDTDRLSILLLFGLRNRDSSEIEKTLIGSRDLTKKERDYTENLIESEDFGEIKSSTAINTIKKIHKLNGIGEAGFRRKNTASLLFRYYYDMSLVFNSLDKIIKQGGNMFFVIGDNKTEANNKEIIIKSGKALEEIGIALGWKLEKVIPITVTQENRLHNKNGITENEIIWFVK